MSKPTRGSIHMHDFKAAGATYTVCGRINPRRSGRQPLVETQHADEVTCKHCRSSARFRTASAPVAA